jgi:hypothetical protein
LPVGFIAPRVAAGATARVRTGGAGPRERR